MESIRQQVCKRDYDDRLSEQREENRLLFLVQRFESSLADILKQHKCKCSEIYFESRDGVTYKLTVGAEYRYKCSRSNQDDSPCYDHIYHCKQRHDGYGFFDMIGLSGSIIVADDWGSTFGY